MSDEQTVLVSGHYYSATHTYHLPDPDDPERPICGRFHPGVEWKRKRRAVLGEGYSLCTVCDPERERNVSHPGTSLASKLRHADPDDVRRPDDARTEGDV